MCKYKLTLLFLFMLNISPVYAAHSWGYEEDNGPATWGKDYKLCTQGKTQSPIEIKASDIKVNPKLPPIKLGYKSSGIDITNTGHDILLNYNNGSKILFDNNEYELLAFHFHAPAEHIVNGKRASIEIHFVHKDKKGHILVVSLMVNNGKMNYALHDIFNNIPQQANSTNFIEDKKINPLDFFPQGGGYYIYTGSFTSPPCAENVTWIILNEPIEASLEQIMKLTSVYRMNNRPVQPLNGRVIERKL